MGGLESSCGHIKERALFLMKTRSSRFDGSAFTAVELLVVVVIIGILCALITSGLRTSLKDAKGIVCASQLRQIGVLIQQYAAEHNNELPPSAAYFFRDQLDWSGAWFDPTSSDGDGTGGLAAYTDKDSLRALVICPLRKASADPKQEPPVPEGFPYAVNFHLLPGSGFYIVRTTSLSNRSDVLLMADCKLEGGWSFGMNSFGVGVSDFVGEVHKNKSANFLWADGHVTNQRVAEIEKKNLLP